MALIRSIKDGNTIAIGGLIKRAEVKVENRVPLLGDIPIVGFLFKNIARYAGASSSDPVRMDLLVFLTVKLAAEENQAQTVASAVAGAP